MLVAKAKGRLKGQPPKLSTSQAHLLKLLEPGEHTIPELAARSAAPPSTA